MTIGRLETRKRRFGAVTEPIEGAAPVDLVGRQQTSDPAALVPVSHTRPVRHWMHYHHVHMTHIRLRRIHMPHVAHVHWPHVAHVHMQHLPPVKPENSLRHYQFLESALMSREMDRL